MPGSHPNQSASGNAFKSTPHTVSHTGQPLTTFDPVQLLNPTLAQRGTTKHSPGTQKAKQTEVTGSSNSTGPSGTAPPQFTFTSPNDSFRDEMEVNETLPTQASILERMHNIQERTQRPQKRLKRSVSPSGTDTSRSSRAPQGSTGIISSHVNDTRRQLAATHRQSSNCVETIQREIEASRQPSPSPSQTQHDQNVVDLTNDAETVDLTADDPAEREVCYGRIEGARIQCHRVPDSGKPISNRGDWPPMPVRLVRSLNKQSLVIKAYDPKNNDFGNVDPRVSLALKPFLDGNFHVRMEARTDMRTKDPFEAPGQMSSKNITVHINLFGPFKYAVEPIGKSLSQKQVWLRNPKTIGHDVEVYNPHTHDHQLSRMAQKAAQKTFSNLSANTGHRMRTMEEQSVEVQSLFDNIQKTANLPMMEPDPNVVSSLLDHQKQALAWMVRREKPIEFEAGKDSSGTLWRCNMRNGRQIYHNVVTGHEVLERPPDTLGGLLADMMGLGKTLSLLALISYTRLDAMDFEANAPQRQNEKHNLPLRNVKSTLLVCPVSVITNWEDQILQHIRKDGLTFYSYHGSNRRKDLDYLSGFDVIITSYSIVKSEMFPSVRSVKAHGASPLASANFFRVVLDEAHTIRSQNTQQFMACIELYAERRWAMTATPVQNRLEDLGAIIRFLRVAPFHEASQFQQHITGPFKLAQPEVLNHLRVLVDTVTLRRLKDTIDLAPRQNETVTLGFSEEEQKLYNFFASNANKRLQAMTSGFQPGGKAKFGSKIYMNILRSILCLRQICAHGKEMLRDDDMQLVEGQSSGTAIDVEEEDTRPALDERQAYSVFEILKETNQAVCIKCNKGINSTVPDLPDADEDEVFCNMLPCYQVVCNSCTKEVKKDMDARSKRGEERMNCPFCWQSWRISLFAITANGTVRAEQLKAELAKQPRKAKILSRYDGPSTKTVELVARLKDTALESMPLEEKGEMPIKSVVFSAWTTHLDLISIALDNEGIEYCTMVGSMSRTQRRASLEEFRTSTTCNVFLVSIGTGGVGLNLTAASRVYLMDIGFNPMAEQQAVDRVHRLGQTRRVTFTRFIMHNSIEGKILELQKKKTDLADLSLQRGKVDKAEAVRARLEELKDLFK